MVSLGFGSLLMLLPSIGGVLNQLLALGSQTLLPSAEAAYPWLLALLGTSLLTGFGLARRIHGRRGAPATPGRSSGIAIAIVLTTAAGALFAGVAVANELALARVRRPASSRYGPTDADPSHRLRRSARASGRDRPARRCTSTGTSTCVRSARST